MGYLVLMICAGESIRLAGSTKIQGQFGVSSVDFLRGQDSVGSRVHTNRPCPDHPDFFMLRAGLSQV